MAGNNPTAAPCANGAGNNPTAAAPFVFAAPFATGGAGNIPTGLPCAVASVKGRMACCDNSRRGVPCAIRASVKGRMVCCDSLDKFGPGAGRKRTPEEVALGIQEWEDAAHLALARHLKAKIVELGHYSRMVERIPRGIHEITRDGVLIPHPGRRLNVVVPYAPNEPAATTLADCGPEDLASP